MFLSLSQSVWHVASLSFDMQKVAERIEVPFGVKTLEGPVNIVLDRGPDPPRRGRGGSALMQSLPNYIGILFDSQ